MTLFFRIMEMNGQTGMHTETMLGLCPSACHEVRHISVPILQVPSAVIQKGKELTVYSMVFHLGQS